MTTDKCFFCKNDVFGRCEFSCFGIAAADRFDLCKDCYFRWINAYNIAKSVLSQAKGSFKSIINSKDAQIGNKLQEMIKESSNNVPDK
jgi:hypothetical protein